MLTDKEVVLDLHVLEEGLDGIGKIKDGFKRTEAGVGQ